MKKLLLMLGIIGIMGACSSTKPVEQPQTVVVEEVEVAEIVTVVKPDK